VHVKANVLLQCHFSRRPLSAELRMDTDLLLEDACRLLQTMVDVISSNGWLKPALVVMEMSQMTVQGLWGEDSPLLQIPHFTPELVDKCASASVPKRGEDGEEEEGPVESVYDVLELDASVRESLLGLSKPQLADVARFCNRYPNVAVAYEIEGEDSIGAEDTVSMTVNLTREDAEVLDTAGLGVVYAPRYPRTKVENWWVMVGDVANNSCLAIKRVTLEKSLAVKLEFPASATPGAHEYTLYFMCDSYMGCDQEYEFTLNVHGSGGAAADASEEEEGAMAD